MVLQHDRGNEYAMRYKLAQYLISFSFEYYFSSGFLSECFMVYRRGSGGLTGDQGGVPRGTALDIAVPRLAPHPAYTAKSTQRRLLSVSPDYNTDRCIGSPTATPARVCLNFILMVLFSLPGKRGDDESPFLLVLINFRF